MKGKNIVSCALVMALASAGLVGCGQPAASTAGSEGAASSSTETVAVESTTEVATEVASSAASSTSTAEESSAADSSVAPASAAAAEIPAEKAKYIALGDAGFSEEDVFELTVELDADDAVPHYEVEFKQGTYEYDYAIALDGSIISAYSEPIG